MLYSVVYKGLGIPKFIKHISKKLITRVINNYPANNKSIAQQYDQTAHHEF